MLRQLEKLPARVDTALHAYCTARNGMLAEAKGLIYPFGVNESQLKAVEQAFRAQISVIEGPPGTDKTQTILNILANILLRGQTVAVLSLNQVVSPSNVNLTERARAFMARASCDFVIYYKVGKTPLGVIEVDGGSHDRPDQAVRDVLKNGILAKGGIPILRLRTVESRIEERIADFIGQWASPALSE